VPGAVTRGRDVPALEVALGLPVGNLSKHLPPLRPRCLPYRSELTPVQEAEFERVVRYKTNDAESRADRRPLTYWRVRKDDGQCAAADLFRELLASYYGFQGYRRTQRKPSAVVSVGTPARASIVDLIDVDALIRVPRLPRGSRAVRRRRRA
jgi:hypothetical protein